MSKLLMVAGGIVEAGPGLPGAVSAFVVSSSARGPTRLFRVHGPVDTVRVEELPPDTAIDVIELQARLHRDLEPVVRDLKKRGGQAGVASPSETWLCELVLAHLAAEQGEGDEDGNAR